MVFCTASGRGISADVPSVGAESSSVLGTGWSLDWSAEEASACSLDAGISSWGGENLFSARFVASEDCGLESSWLGFRAAERAGTTPVMPSGSPVASLVFASLSPAPPALGVKAFWALAIFRNFSATPFFPIIGPNPGLNDELCSLEASVGCSVSVFAGLSLPLRSPPVVAPGTAKGSAFSSAGVMVGVEPGSSIAPGDWGVPGVLGRWSWSDTPNRVSAVVRGLEVSERRGRALSP